MHTILMRNQPRRGTGGATWSIEVLGNSPAKLAVQQSVKELDHYPAKAARRSLIDMLDIIEKHNLEICYTEHSETDEGLESWLFILQG